MHIVPNLIELLEFMLFACTICGEPSGTVSRSQKKDDKSFEEQVKVMNFFNLKQKRKLKKRLEKVLKKKVN